jgi:hypothetical protein
LWRPEIQQFLSTRAFPYYMFREALGHLPDRQYRCVEGILTYGQADLALVMTASAVRFLA